MRAEPAGHAAIKTTLLGRQSEEGAQEQRQKTNGFYTKQRARGKFVNFYIVSFYNTKTLKSRH